MIKVVARHPPPVTLHRIGHAALKGEAWWALLTALVLLTAGCGFHLRGSLGELEALPPVMVRGEGALPGELQRALRNGGTPVVSEASEAQMIVILSDVRRSRRASAVGSTGRAQEYELHASVRFRVEDPAGASLTPEQAVAVSRSFTYSSTDVNAKANEEQNLYEDMQFDMVRQILLRIQAVKPPPSVTEPAP
jgi:LPS-assembly lipoprotein